MHGVRTFIVNVSYYYVESAAGMIGLIIVWAVAIRMLLKKKQGAQIVKSGGIFIVPALVILFFMASLEFVKHGDYNQRYICDSLILCALFFAYLTTGFIENLALSEKVIEWIPRALAILSVVVLFISFHPRPFETPVRRIAETIPHSSELLSHKEADGIVGNYWSVWPAVWLENATGNRKFYGVTQRFTVISKGILDNYYFVKHATLLAYPGDQWITPDLEVYFSSPNTRYRVDKDFNVISVSPKQNPIIRRATLPLEE
jgi:hypothetical protein